jgi:thiosulfate dehydrogenase [quinone] large subunit
MDRTKNITITRQLIWTLTIFSAILYILLSAIFADDLFLPPLWRGEAWIASPVITYLAILAIIAAGWAQARAIPEQGLPLRLETTPLAPGQVNDPVGWRLLLGNIFLSIVWLPMRFFVGREWLVHGLEKISDPAWTGNGEALRAYWEQAVAIPEQGRPPITYGWFRQFLQYMLDNGWYSWFAKLVAWGEVLVALGLILGVLVGLTALFGTIMNFSYMLAGSASTNPVLFGLGVFLVLAWKVGGHWGLDRWILPALGTPWARAEAQVDAVAARTAREPSNESAPRPT